MWHTWATLLYRRGIVYMALAGSGETAYSEKATVAGNDECPVLRTTSNGRILRCDILLELHIFLLSASDGRPRYGFRFRRAEGIKQMEHGHT